MMFLITIYKGPRPYWSLIVEAEDGDGAAREALNALKKDPNCGIYYSAERRIGDDYAVEVEAVSRKWVASIPSPLKEKLWRQE